jgi:hypothetical protein
MNEKEMNLAGIYRDENGRYHRKPRTKEVQEVFDEYVRIRDKCEEYIKKLFENPSFDAMEKFSILLADQNEKRSEAHKLIDQWRFDMQEASKDSENQQNNTK